MKEAEVCKLSSLFDIGSSKRVLKSDWKSEGVPFYRGREITKLAAEGVVNNELFISEEHYATLSEKHGVPREGDIVITAIGTIGNSHIVRNSDRFYFKDASVLWMKRRGELVSEYVNFWLKSPLFFDQLDRGNGATVDTLNITKLKSLQIPIPPLSEQEEIVEVLDTAFAAIDQAKANSEQNIANAKELFQSKLNQIFSQKGEGWVETTLGEVCENLDSRRVPITKNKRTEGPIPYYGASGIVDYVADYIFDEDLLLVSEDGANLLARTYPIAFSISGKTWVNNHAHALRFKEMTSQIFIEHYLNSIKLDDYISGMAQPKLNQKKLNSITVPFPDLDKQEQVIDVVVELDDRLKETSAIYQTKLASLDELKKSILQKAFAGELT